MFSIQTWLGESEDSQKSGGTPGYFSVGMSGTVFPFADRWRWDVQQLLTMWEIVVMALAVTYLPLFIPPPGAKTTPPPPVPLQ